MLEVRVDLGERSYPIRIGSGLLTSLGAACREQGLGRQAVIVTNTTVAALYLQQGMDSLAQAGISAVPVVLPDGEVYKNLETLAQIYDALVTANLERGGFLVALGGGVVGDITGFAAATYLRGVPFVQVPTTLLAQVDSSVGGKTAINHHAGKNLIGAFYQPSLVQIDVTTLQTLSEREFCSGLAEVIKYGAVLSAPLFARLEGEMDALRSGALENLSTVIADCCRIKAAVVGSDEREQGVRAVLNFGHTFGHVFELLGEFSRYTHGEAVSIGMLVAARLSTLRGLATTHDLQRLECLLAAAGLPVSLPAYPYHALRESLLHDKKVREGGVNFVFMRGIGEYLIQREADIDRLLADCGFLPD